MDSDAQQSPSKEHTPFALSKRSPTQRCSQVDFVRTTSLGLTNQPSLLPSPSSSPPNGFNRRASTRRSDSLPNFPPISQDSSKGSIGRVQDLPPNPKTWTPSELAVYLAHVLRLAPARLREDLQAIVRKNALTGRRFLRMSEHDYLNHLSLNRAWTTVFCQAKDKLRIECLRANILHESDFEEASPNLPVPMDESRGYSWKTSWRRSKGVNSKGRVKGLTDLFEKERPEQSQDNDRRLSYGSSSSGSRASWSSADAHPSPEVPFSDPTIPDIEDESSGCDQSFLVNWSFAEPLDVQDDLLLSSSAADLVVPRESRVHLATREAAEDATVKKAPTSLSRVFDDASAHAPPVCAPSKPLPEPGTVYQEDASISDLLAATELSSTDLKNMTQVRSRNGSMILIKKSQLADLESRMSQLEEMLQAVQHGKGSNQPGNSLDERRQIARPLEDDVSLRSLGGYLLMTALGVGIVAVEVVASKLWKR